MRQVVPLNINFISKKQDHLIVSHGYVTVPKKVTNDLDQKLEIWTVGLEKFKELFP